MKSKGSDPYHDQQRDMSFGYLTLKQPPIMLISKNKFLQPMPRSPKSKTCMNLNLGHKPMDFILAHPSPISKSIHACMHQTQGLVTRYLKPGTSKKRNLEFAMQPLVNAIRTRFCKACSFRPQGRQACTRDLDKSPAQKRAVHVRGLPGLAKPDNLRKGAIHRRPYLTGSTPRKQTQD